MLAARAIGTTRDAARVGFVDIAKGWSIVMVVAMHATLGVGLATGGMSWLHPLVAFAKPFRMPDFFIVAGLFAGPALAGPWRRFVDGKLLHFAYFYVVWLAIELAVKAGTLGIATAGAFASAFLAHLVEPFGSMWFIQALPLLFLATRLTHGLPLPCLLAGAVALHLWAAASPGPNPYAMESRATAYTAINAFALFWVYFLLGVRGRATVLRFASWAARSVPPTCVALAAWAVVEALACARGVTSLPGLDLLFGTAGAGAVIAAAALLDCWRGAGWLRAMGRNALPVYLSFFLPMAAARSVLVRLAPDAPCGVLAVTVTACAIGGALLLHRLCADTALGFLFARPGWARLKARREHSQAGNPAAHYSGAQPASSRASDAIGFPRASGTTAARSAST